MNMTQDQETKRLLLKHNTAYSSWPLDWLANYIEKLQRKTIIDKSNAILQTISVVKSNCLRGNNYFLQLEKLFTESVDRLSAHMRKEEQHLFPFIREMLHAKELNGHMNRTVLDKVDWLIGSLSDEHAVERKQLEACTALRVNCIAISNINKPVNTLFIGLAEFEYLFQLHIDLQHTFLFPKILNTKYGLA